MSFPLFEQSMQVPCALPIFNLLEDVLPSKAPAGWDIFNQVWSPVGKVAVPSETGPFLLVNILNSIGFVCHCH